MKRVIKNNNKIIIGFIIGLLFSITTVYAVDAYIESNKVAYTNHNKNNVEEAIDELYEKSGMHKDKWVDPILNGADPVFDNEGKLIPVEIKPNGDVYYASLNSEWYNYSKKRWANAVILIDNPSNTNYQVGDHILENDIESYFVWIPRYQYKVWDLGKYTSAPDGNTLTDKDYNSSTAQALNKSILIDIKFGNIDKAPKMVEPSITGVYYTHPAFTLGDKDLNGLWIGKFETGYKGATSKETAEVNREETTSVIIKPDVYLWRNISVKNIFMTSYNYDRNLDSHMIKNTEWGAAAYLSHSQYGIGNEIRLNNTSDYKTGYSAAANTNQSTRLGTYAESTDKTITQPWNTATGYLASTTGNISGIYDMSGGGWEYVAGCLNETIGASEFTIDELKYYTQLDYLDIYDKNSLISSYNNRILGDATGETGPFFKYNDGDNGVRAHNSWYSDWAWFIFGIYPWFVRGGGYDSGGLSGAFNFSRFGGEASEYFSYRITLAPI